MVQFRTNTPQNIERSSVSNFYEKTISKVNIFIQKPKLHTWKSRMEKF